MVVWLERVFSQQSTHAVYRASTSAGFEREPHSSVGRVSDSERKKTICLGLSLDTAATAGAALARPRALYSDSIDYARAPTAHAGITPQLMLSEIGDTASWRLGDLRVLALCGASALGRDAGGDGGERPFDRLTVLACSGLNRATKQYIYVPSIHTPCN